MDPRWKPVSMPSDFKKYLKDNGFQLLILFDNEGGFKLVNQEGAEIIPLANLAEFTLRRGSNSNCVFRMHQGKPAWVHADPQAVGHLFPCH
jgi:hypothetical protein